MNSDRSAETSNSKASNDFLNREIQRLETERDTVRRELRQIQRSYAWKIVKRYRRWIERHRDNSAVRLYEKLAVWVLDRSVGSHRDDSVNYQLWLEAHEMTPESLEAARSAAATFPYRPLISVVLEVADNAATESGLKAAVESVRAQIYDNWQLRIVIDATIPQPIEAMLSRYAAGDARISLRHRMPGGEASPTAVDLLDLAEGEFSIFMAYTGSLSAGNFYAVVKLLNRNGAVDIIYWDDDRIDSEGRRTKPFFKPDWSPELLFSMNYLGDSFIIRTALAKQIGGPRHSFGTCQNYDFALRAVDLSNSIVHIPDVLSHRSEVPQVESEAECERQSMQALDEALHRRGEAGRVEVVGPGLYAVRHEIRGEPLVSILIPTRDKCHLLRQCLESIERNTDYKNYEIIVLDNDSTEPDTLAYFDQIAGKVQVHRYPGRFNFSAINNYGVSKAKGELLLFLNNDTQVIRSDWMRALIEQAQRPQIGAVGAKLLFADGRVQHAGAVLGIGGMVGHAFRLTAGNEPHYFGLSDVIRDCSSVTAACMMMRRSVFDEVAGYDEKFLVDFADIDLCLRVRHRGYRIVYTPFALLYHYESATRRRMHVSGDLEGFVKRWDHCLKQPDPYYGHHLTLDREDWSLAP